MSNHTLLVHPEKILAHLPGYVFWKDCYSQFLGCNQNFANFAGIASSKAIVGKSDHSVRYTMEQNYTHVLKDDRCVTQTGKPLLEIKETQIYPCGKRLLIVTNKYPLFNQHGEIVGLFGIYMPLKELTTDIPLLQNSTKKNQLITGTFGTVSISLREAQCIHALLSGKSAKEIAKVFNISPRTIETHIGHIKEKIKCHTRLQLVSTILESDFLKIFPIS